MKHCEDCIHDEVCGMWAVDSGIPFANADNCVHYKAKSDVVEVVLCRDCKHFISEVCQHDFGMNVSWSDDFCSCGERKGESDA